MSDNNGFGGQCFDSAQEYMLVHARAMEAHIPSVTLVHGYVTGQAGVHEGKRLSHAWVELECTPEVILCIDAAANVALLRDRYYQLGEIEPSECFRYTLDDMLEWLAKDAVPPFQLPRTSWETLLMNKGVINDSGEKL